LAISQPETSPAMTGVSGRMAIIIGSASQSPCWVPKS
jgi:hypothetical protein